MSDELKTVVREYRGSGVLELSNGTDSRCQFVVHQFSDGDVVLACDHSDDGAMHLPVGTPSGVSRFRGQTDSQRPLVIEPPFFTVSVEGGTEGTKTRHTCRRVDLRLADEWAASAIMTFEITNCFLAADENRPRRNGGGSEGVLAIQVAGRELVFRAVPDVDGIKDYLRSHHGSAITAFLEVPVTCRDDAEETIRVVDRICALLSISRGTLVTWLNYEILSGDGDSIAHPARNAKTRSYCRSELIDADRRGETKRFLEQAYEGYVAVESAFQMLRVVHARLDVNEGAFLETRGLVASALIEYLATAYVHERGTGNDRSAHIVTKIILLCGQLSAGFAESEIRAIWRTRNSLAHRLKFLTDKPYVEHQELANFLNVIVLRLLGYTGPYLDCRVWQRRSLQ